MPRKTTTIIAVIILLLVLFFTTGINNVEKNYLNAKIGGARIILELADTPEKRVLGLSGRQALSSDAGMLFVLDEPGIYPIWMKDMNFPIDIIWLDGDMRIIGTKINISPETFPTRFITKKPASYIVETSAGFIEKNKIKVGDLLILN